MYMYIRSWIVSHVPLYPYPLLLNKGQGCGVLNAIFNNISVISWPSVLLVEEIGSAQRKPPTCHKHIISHNVVLSTPHLSGIRTHNFSGDRH